MGFSSSMFKLILLDYSMPDMDGPQVCREIRNMVESSNGTSTQPYICCCTAYTDQEYVEVAFKAGMNDFLTKPINT